MPAATPPLLPRRGSPSTASFLHSTMPGSPKAQSLDMAPGSPLFRSLSPCHPPLQGSPVKGTDISLSNVHVPLEAIRPSKSNQDEEKEQIGMSLTEKLNEWFCITQQLKGLLYGLHVPDLLCPACPQVKSYL